MAIYRGPGGSGDATADSANTSQVAETFATQAGVSAAAASSSANAASASESAASAAQIAAEAAQLAAETAETNAETAETNAETAETNAEAAQTAAEAAQLAAENAQTAAELAETNAETAETNAVAAQLAAESARDSALAAYDNFDDRYLGAKTSDPTLDNDGDALIAGALYFNSVDGAMRVYTGSVWVDAYAAGTSFLAKANNLSDLPNVATARQNLDLEIGVDVQAYDATILKSADIGVTVQAYDADTAKYDDATANFTGTLQNGGSNVLVDTDIGSTVQAYDATIVVDADIGVTVQGYDADTAKYDDATANFTGTLQQGGNNVLTTASDYLDSADIGVTVQGYDANTLKSGDIGVTVQGYDADTAKYDDATANFTGTLQNGGSNVLVDSDIGSTVQAYDATIVVDADIGVTVQGYDADTVKYDDVNPTFTDTGAIKIPAGTELQRPGTPVAGQLRFNDDSDEFEGYDGTAWGAISGGGGGSGDVVGPVSATDNAVARFDGTTGKLIQNSAVTIADTSGDITTGGVVLTANGSVSNPSYSASGDTNTGIYFPAADTIGFVCGGTEDFRVDGDGQLWNTVNSQVGSDYTTLYKGYLCRAWVNFNGTGTPAIRASGNVSSITDNTTGDYTINFTTSLPDANYSLEGTAETASKNNAGRSVKPLTLNTGSANILTVNSSGSYLDPVNVLVSIHR